MHARILCIQEYMYKAQTGSAGADLGPACCNDARGHILILRANEDGPELPTRDIVQGVLHAKCAWLQSPHIVRRCSTRVHEVSWAEQRLSSDLANAFLSQKLPASPGKGFILRRAISAALHGGKQRSGDLCECKAPRQGEERRDIWNLAVHRL